MNLFRPTTPNKEKLIKLMVKCQCSKSRIINLAIEGYEKTS